MRFPGDPPGTPPAHAAAMASSIAHLRARDIELIDVIGRGGMATVYRGRQRTLGRDVAVKILDHTETLEARSRFVREARLAAQIHHPNAIDIYDFGVLEDGRMYLVMELLRGQDLSQLMRRPLSLERIVNVLQQVLAALDEAHAVGVLHRDVKPENIFVDSRGGAELVTLLDFGLARPLFGGSNITAVNMACGTAEYMSPEQSCGEDVDCRTDVYAATVVLFELLTGEQPFAGATPAETLRLQVDAPIPDPAELAPWRKLAPVWTAIVRRGLAKERSDRFASAIELSHALADALGRRDSSVPPTRAIGQCPACGETGMGRFCGHCGGLLVSRGEAVTEELVKQVERKG